MKLTKKEWKTYKENNISTIIGYHNDNIRLLGKNYGYLKYKFNKIKDKKLQNKILQFKFKTDFRLSGKSSIPMLDFIITTKCTLKCAQCSSMMPFYNNETHYNETFESFKSNLDNLLKNVNKIYRFQLIGGEPLLNKDLPRMLEYAAKKKQLKVVQIVTNSTILPNDKLINAMKKFRHKCTVAISDYTSNLELKNLKLQEVLSKFTRAGICTYVVDYDWFARGEIKKEDRNIEELKNTMKACWQHKCTAYCDGELHLCSRSIAIKRNLNPDLQDYVKVQNNKNYSQEIINLFAKEYAEACDYCHTRTDVKIPRGVQIERERENNCTAAQDRKSVV